MADFFVSQRGCYTTLGDTTRVGSLSSVSGRPSRRAHCDADAATLPVRRYIPTIRDLGKESGQDVPELRLPAGPR